LGHVGGFSKLIAPALEVIELLRNHEYILAGREACEKHVAAVEHAADGNKGMPAGVEIRSTSSVSRGSVLEGDWIGSG